MSRAYWGRVRAHYARHEAALEAVASMLFPARWGIDPYAWDFEAGIRMTPIEAAIWHDIRDACAVLYPQYPVAGYFVDFGNPAAKVALECDGAAFHKDAERDAIRQGRIEAAGWTVYRISGSDCVKTDREVEDERGRLEMVTNPARVLIGEIVRKHGIGL